MTPWADRVVLACATCVVTHPGESETLWVRTVVGSRERTRFEWAAGVWWRWRMRGRRRRRRASRRFPQGWAVTYLVRTRGGRHARGIGTGVITAPAVPDPRANMVWVPVLCGDQPAEMPPVWIAGRDILCVFPIADPEDDALVRTIPVDG